MVSAKTIKIWNRYLEVYFITMAVMVDQFCLEKYPIVFNEIHIKAMLPILVGGTNNNITWNEDIQSFMLSCLKSICNKI